MATWADFEAAEPEMAAVGRGLLEQHHLAYIATVRTDGSPRLHPVSPFIIDGHLLVSTPVTSPKGGDQLREPRVVIHMLPGERDDECMIRARARLVPAGPLKTKACEYAHYVRQEDYLFEYAIESVMTAYWEQVGQPGTYPMRRRWRAPAG